MKFIDSTEIHVRAGDGGSGMVSFRSARNMPKLGCDGGDGGFGGDVVLVGNRQLNTLSSLRFHREYRAESGARGGSNNCTGRDGKTLYIQVPLGTEVVDIPTGRLIGEVIDDQQEMIIAKGGKRGLGNQRFVTSTHQTAEEYTSGGKGEEAALRLELKLLADVGLAGLPNAGKSTLLSRISSARPKIADYPFTTLVPNLGVVDLTDSDDLIYESLVVADVPGLIEGASEGRGLGLAFLRHLERTKVIAYVIDAFDESGAKPEETLALLRNEMVRYSPELSEKRCLVILNKLDLAPPETQDEKIAELSRPLLDLGLEVFSISAVQGRGLRGLKRRLYEIVREEKNPTPTKQVMDPVAAALSDTFMVKFRLPDIANSTH